MPGGAFFVRRDAGFFARRWQVVQSKAVFDVRTPAPGRSLPRGPRSGGHVFFGKGPSFCSAAEGASLLPGLGSRLLPLFRGRVADVELADSGEDAVDDGSRANTSKSALLSELLMKSMEGLNRSSTKNTPNMTARMSTAWVSSFQMVQNDFFTSVFLPHVNDVARTAGRRRRAG